MIELDVKWSTENAYIFLKDFLISNAKKNPIIKFGIPVAGFFIFASLVATAIIFLKIGKPLYFAATLASIGCVIASVFIFFAFLKRSAKKISYENENKGQMQIKLDEKNIFICLTDNEDNIPKYAEIKWSDVTKIKMFKNFSYFLMGDNDPAIVLDYNLIKDATEESKERLKNILSKKQEKLK